MDRLFYIEEDLIMRKVQKVYIFDIFINTLNFNYFNKRILKLYVKIMLHFMLLFRMHIIFLL